MSFFLNLRSLSKAMTCFENLDSLLINTIAEFAYPYEGSLRLTCRAMRAMIPTPRKMSTNELLLLGAKIGDAEICVHACVKGANDWYGMLKIGALNGRKNICKLARAWSRDSINYSWILLLYAACGNQLDLCNYALSKGADVWYMLRGAISGNHLELCERAISLGANLEQALLNEIYDRLCDPWEFLHKLGRRNGISCSQFLLSAVRKHDLELCARFHQWGLEDGERMEYSHALGSAAALPNHALCNLLHSWAISENAPTSYDEMLQRAARHGDYDLCNRACEWGARNFREMTIGYRNGRDRELSDLADLWRRRATK